MIKVTLYSKPDCSLCDQAKKDLAALEKKIPHTLALVDISEDEDLKKSYADKVPVLQVGPYVLEAPFDSQKIEMTLAAARDRLEQSKDDEELKARQKRGAQFSGADRFTHWFSKRYLLVINIFIFLYVGLPFLAPYLMQAGLPGLAKPIYSVYGAVCHQMAFRSWFLYGDQPVYPRVAAGVEGLDTFGEISGLSEEDLLAARQFVGNEQVGYKVAYCQRDVAIYGAMLGFGLLFGLTKRKIPPLPWYAWIIIGVAPIALDGFSQLISQIPGFSLWAYRESTPFLRTLTGALFGFSTAWFGFPLLEESMVETRQMLASKLARLGGGGRTV